MATPAGRAGAKGLPTWYHEAKSVTPADGTALTNGPCIGLFFSATAGQTLRITTLAGSIANFTFGAAGTYEFHVGAQTVESTGTNVTGILALY